MIEKIDESAFCRKTVVSNPPFNKATVNSMDIHQYNNPRARRLLLLYTPFLNPTAGILDDEREDGSRSRDALDRETLKSEIASVKQLCRVHSDYCEEHAS